MGIKQNVADTAVGGQKLPDIVQALTELDRLAAYVYLTGMDEKQELRFLLAHPELEPRRRYYG